MGSLWSSGSILVLMACVVTSFLLSVGGEVQIPPEVTNPKTGAVKYIMTRDKSVTVQCNATGYPHPRYTWFRDGIKLTPDNPYLKAFPNGTLRLVDFSSFKNGYYQCRAANAAGVSLSDILHIMAEPKVRGSDTDEVYELTEGDPFQIECDKVPSVQRMVKRWYTGMNDQLRVDKRRAVNQEGTLFFSYVLKEDSSRSYKCGLAFKAVNTKDITLFKKGEIIVHAKETEPIATRPRLVYSKRNVKAVIGHTVILECFFASKPVAEITWLNSSNHVVTENNPRFKTDSDGRKMIIDPVQQQDEGTFTCIGKNNLGSAKTQIIVNVTSPPLPVHGGALISRTVPDQRDIILNCKAKPATNEIVNTPRWYRNGEILSEKTVPDPSRYKFSSDFTELHIQDLDKKIDTACFQCNTTNSEGYKFFDAYLKVINSIVITKRPADVILIEHGDAVDITIQATGDHCCDINMLWYLDSNLIYVPQNYLPFQMDPKSGQILFNTSLLNDNNATRYLGTYICRVSNQYEAIDVKFVISLTLGNKEPVTAESGSIGMWWIGLLCGILAILIAVIIVVVLYKTNYPSSSYKLEKQEIKHNLNPKQDLLDQSFQEI